MHPDFFTLIFEIVLPNTPIYPHISARLLLTKPMFVLQVLEHVGRVSSMTGHFMEAHLADRASVHINRAIWILQVSEIFPDRGADALRGRVKVSGLASCIHSQL